MSSILVIAENKKAFFNYQILESFEAGIVLVGSEVKSLREKNVTFKDAYVDIQNGEAFVRSMHIGEYRASSHFQHQPERLRKLLLHKKEIEKLLLATRAGGMTLVPIKIYFSKGRVKLQIGLAKGKKTQDKRESIKKRDVERQLRQSKSRSRS